MKHKYGYGECARSGDIVPIKDLVPDGHLRGVLVSKDWWEPRHPAEDPPVIVGEKHDVPAPELSKPPGEGVAAPALVFDELGKLL